MPRIVSLIASATEMVHALGLGEFQVGRSHECDFPPEVSNLPVCTRPKFDTTGSSLQIDQLVRATLLAEGSVYDVYTDVIDGLEPTHILTQTQCRVCAVTKADVEMALSRSYRALPQVIALEPNSLAEIWADLDRIAAAFGIQAKGEEVRLNLQQRINDLRSSGSLRVALIEWIEPIMYAGHWIPELLQMAGGLPVTLDEDPDVIVIAPCGFDLHRTREEIHWLTHRPDWQYLKAVRGGRVYLCDANQYMTRPGPRIVESLEALTEMLGTKQNEPKLRGIAWETLY